MYSACGNTVFADIILGGEKIKPISFGSPSTFLNMCKTLRTFDELRYAYPASCGDYETMMDEMPVNITRVPYKGNLCFQIDVMNGGSAFLALTTVMEVLRIENLVLAGFKNLECMAPAITNKFKIQRFNTVPYGPRKMRSSIV